MDNTISISARLRKFREETGLSQKEFAEKIGTNQSYYSDVENNRRKVTSGLLGKIKKHFEISNDWIFYGEEATVSKKNTPKSVFDTLDTVEEVLQSIYKRAGRVKDIGEFTEQENEALVTAVMNKMDKEKREAILLRPHDPELYYHRFLYDVLKNERKDLGEVNFEMSGIVSKVWILSELCTAYFNSFDKEVRGKSYNEYKKNRIKHLEKYIDYLEIVKTLNGHIDVFLTGFKKYDTKNILDDL